MRKVLIFYKLILTIFLFSGFVWHLFAQQLDQEDKIIFSNNGTIKYIKFGEDETLNYETSHGKEIEFKVPYNSSDFFTQILEATEDDQFKLIRKRQTRTGYIIEKYAQFYKDITVKDAKYSMHFYNGKLFKANGKYVKIKDLDIVPSISPDEAMKRFAEFQNIPLSEIKIMKVGY
jgi:Zn-dependent metalloprotease